ncbi:hypothetical protein AC623_02340 [Bacillus sp. FJAT-27231]|uniref:YusW family protein n=1 Tax=Bacillus sp. FJAT-27231 TaxID=1679168 RepID=UPI0006709BC7|nr:YusW family protein [Bacillus sp. FJAT-27231]KMY52969.1 hypothetical protein AC623_02340 [Bacillus sp. FJAT-27231]
MKGKMADLGYREFELEISYEGGKEYEAEIERNEKGAIEVKIEDELNGVEIEGTEAFKLLYPRLKRMAIKRKTPKRQAIRKALQAFHLPANYKKIEIEIMFKDGSKLEFEDKK